MIKNKKMIKFFNRIIILFGFYYIAYLVILIVSIFIKIPFFEKYGVLFGVIPFGIVLFIILFCPEARIVQHPIKYTFNFNFENYDDFIIFLDTNTKRVKLEKLNEQRNDAILYTRTSYFGNWREYYIAFNFDEINGSAEGAIRNMSEILNNMTRNIKNTWRTAYLCGFFICVKKENKVFHEIINEQWYIPIDGERISADVYIVGCSFEKNNAYIIRPKEMELGYYNGSRLLTLFKRMRKIMNFKIRNAKDKTRL